MAQDKYNQDFEKKSDMNKNFFKENDDLNDS